MTVSDTAMVYPRKEFDEIDEQLITLLEQDGRLSYADLAQEVGLTSGGVRARVMRLQDRGIIRVMAVVSARAIGLDSIASVQVEVDGEHDIDDVADEISAIEGVRYVVLGSGRFNLLLEVYAESMHALYSLINRQIKRVPGVTRIETFTYDLVHTHRPVFPVVRR